MDESDSLRQPHRNWRFTLRSLFLLHFVGAFACIGIYPLSVVVLRELHLPRPTQFALFTLGILGGTIAAMMMRKRVHWLWALAGGLGVCHIIVVVTLVWLIGIPVEWIY